MSAILEIKNLNMVFEQKSGMFGDHKRIPALSNVNLEIKPGEIVGLVGESGCGKTTLGKIITGLHKPTSGEILFEGKNIHAMRSNEFKNYRHSVQLVQQDSFAALNPVRTIFKSIADPIIQNNIVKGKRAVRQKVCELLETVELAPAEQFLEKYPHQLSGGQRQRVLMARAISLNPKLIVADEPVSMIDVSLRLSILKLMSSLNKRLGVAFVYITHDLATARYIAQNGKLLVMYLGKIVEQGSVSDVLANPRHPYLQALLTAVPIPDPRVAKLKKALPLKSLEMSDLSNLPQGCSFNPRCPYADSLCESKEPVLTPHGDTLISCHHTEKVPEWKPTASIG